MEIVERVLPNRLFNAEDLTLSPQYTTPTRVEAFKRPTILIFEESREMQEHYKRFLKSDYNLLMVESARYGIKMLQALPVDLILYNVELDRETEAIGLLKVFRRLASGASRPVVAMTGYSASPELASLRKARFDAYLSKPFTLRTLQEVIIKCIAKRTASIINGIDLSLFRV